MFLPASITTLAMLRLINAQVIVLDAGSTLFRVGLAGEDANPVPIRSPLRGLSAFAIFLADLTIPADLVGRPQLLPALAGVETKPYYIGPEAEAKRGTLILSHPVQNAIIANADDFEKVLQYVYSDTLRLPSKDHAVLATESPFNQPSARRELAKMLFSTFNVPALNITSTSNLVLLSTGRSTGLVVEFGGDVTQIVPIYNNAIQQASASRFNLGGNAVTNKLRDLLYLNGYSFVASAQYPILEDMKKKVCYLADDYAGEVERLETTGYEDIVVQYETSDGNVVEVAGARFEAPEVLFEPSLLGLQFEGLDMAIFKAITNSDAAIQKELWENIVLVCCHVLAHGLQGSLLTRKAGGNSQIPNFQSRIYHELAKLAPPEIDPSVITAADPQSAAWKGGSQVAAADGFVQNAVTRDMYQAGNTIYN